MSCNNNIFQKIKESCAYVAENAEKVRINYNYIPDYAASINLLEIEEPIMDTENHYVDDNLETTLNYFTVLDTINFGSGFFKYLKKKDGKNGYFTIASYLKDYFLKYNNFKAEALINVTAEDCAKIFKQNKKDEKVYELMKMFANALNELGHFIKNTYKNSFTYFIESALNSADKLINNLLSLKYFNDTAKYNSKTIYLLKRAQIMVSDINFALGGKGAGFFYDIDELTIFADNLVPHVLKTDKILNYSKELELQINSGCKIKAGSVEEIEIRACSVHAVELICKSVKKRNKHINAQKLDYLLWNKGQQDIYRKEPTHITETYYY